MTYLLHCPLPDDPDLPPKHLPKVKLHLTWICGFDYDFALVLATPNALFLQLLLKEKPFTSKLHFLNSQLRLYNQFLRLGELILLANLLC